MTLNMTTLPCHYAEYYYVECRFFICFYAECRYAECHYAECRGALILVCFIKSEFFFKFCDTGFLGKQLMWLLQLQDLGFKFEKNKVGS